MRGWGISGYFLYFLIRVAWHVRAGSLLIRCAQLGDASSYKILSQSECTTLDGVDDAEEFRGVKAAFDTIGMDEESQVQVWKMLAAVLTMSNLEFDKVDHEQGEIASISDREVRKL